MSLGLTGVVAQEIANRPYDRELGEMVHLIARQLVVEPGRGADAPVRVRLKNPSAAELIRSDDVDRVYYQVLGARGEFVLGDRDLPVPDDDSTGRTLRFRDDTMRDEPVREGYLSPDVELLGFRALGRVCSACFDNDQRDKATPIVPVRR